MIPGKGREKRQNRYALKLSNTCSGNVAKLEQQQSFLRPSFPL